MAQEMRQALQIAENLVHLYNQPHPKIWLPRLSLAWLGVPPGPVIAEDSSAPFSGMTNSSESLDESVEDLSCRERKEGMVEQRFALMRMRTEAGRFSTKKPIGKRERAKRELYSLTLHISTLTAWLWSNDAMLKFRVELWNLNRTLKRSSHHFGHALKCAVGVALLTLPAFLPENSSGEYIVIVFLTLV